MSVAEQRDQTKRSKSIKDMTSEEYWALAKKAREYIKKNWKRGQQDYHNCKRVERGFDPIDFNEINPDED